MKPWACVARFGGVGDNLIASSVLPLLARDYNVEVITRRPHGVVFENNPHIAKLSYKDDDDLPPLGLEWQQWFTKRAKEYEGGLFHLSHSVESLAAFGPGQTPFYWPAPFRRSLCDRSYLEIAHDICGVRHEFAPAFFPTDEEVEKAEKTLRLVRPSAQNGKIIAWAIAGSRLDKLHPSSRSIVARLIRETGSAVVMFGAGGKDFEVAKDIQRYVIEENGSDRGLHLALSPEAGGEQLGKHLPQATEAPSWPIRRSLATIQRCDIMVGPDSGLAWGVASLPMPKVVLLSHASAKNITAHWRNTVTLHADPKRVPCYPCHQLHDDYATCVANAFETGAACISDIPIASVVGEVQDALRAMPWMT